MKVYLDLWQKIGPNASNQRWNFIKCDIMWVTSMSPWCAQSLLCHPAPSPPHRLRPSIFYFFHFKSYIFHGLHSLLPPSYRLKEGLREVRKPAVESLSGETVDRGSHFSSHSCNRGGKVLQINCWFIHCGKVIFVWAGGLCVHVCIWKRDRGMNG